MKYWIFPVVLEWTGLIIAVLLCITLVDIIQSGKADKSLVIAICGTILAFMAVFKSHANGLRIVHQKCIFKKAGLWTDDIIKKKDLPKQEKK